MRKRILLVLLAVVLITGGIAGGVYAAGEHEPVDGNKLVGFGPFGKQQTGTPGEPGYHVIFDDCTFRFTNPDCVNNIIIERVSIISGIGEVIYEGPYLRITPDGDRVVSPILHPHLGGHIELRNWMRDEDGNWLSEEEARELPVASYTVEIEWDADGKTCPLMGWGEWRHTDIYPSGPGEPAIMYPTALGIPMVNMTGHSK